MRSRALGSGLVSFALAAFVLALAAAALGVGPDLAPTSAALRRVVLVELRLPRVILAVLIGGSLGLAGAALQGYTRNPLADPGVLGVSATAALGAVISLFYGWSAHAPWLTPACAMLGATLGVLALLLLGARAGGIAGLLLAGVVLNGLAGAATALALSLAPSPFAATEISDWLMGGLDDRSLDDVRLAAPCIVVGCALLANTGRTLDALTLGETGARALGVRLGATRTLLALGVGLATGAGVAVAGVIGFVGLITPHLLRPLVGARPGALLVPSLFGGAALTLAADFAVRLAPTAGEVRLGVAMTALGSPFFLWLVVARPHRAAA